MISQNIFISGFHFSHFPGNERCKTENQNGNRKTEKVKHFIFSFLEKQEKRKNGKMESGKRFPLSISVFRFPYSVILFHVPENGKCFLFYFASSSSVKMEK